MSQERKPERREIDPSGIDEEGNQCWWTGFDKEKGVYWGIPKEEKTDSLQSLERK